LENNANILINDFLGNSLLHITARTGQQEMAEKLIAQGLDVNALNNSAESPLLLAVQAKYPPVVQRLIENGARVDISDKEGNTALNLAVVLGSVPIVNMLLDNGASVNILNDLSEGPLLLAVKNGNRILAQKLLEQGSDIFAESAEGISPVWYVCNSNQKELLALFLERGLSADYARPVDSFDGKDGKYLERLIERTGGRIFILGFEPHYAGETLLHTATKMGYLSLVKQLLDSGATIDKQDATGNTALHYAAAYGKKDVLRYLLSNGSVTDITNVLEQKAIDYSNMQGFNEITALLIDAGAQTDPLKGEPGLPEKKVFTEPLSNMDMGMKKKALFDLKDLLDAGIINQEEFDAEKAKILKN